MLREKIDSLIAESMKADDKFNVDMFRLVKAEYLKYNASKEAVKTPMNNAIEVNILKKMAKQRRESAELYGQGGRTDLQTKELAEAEFIEAYLPQEATVEDIEKAIDSATTEHGIVLLQKNMGQIIKKVKELLPNADGKLVADLVKKRLS